MVRTNRPFRLLNIDSRVALLQGTILNDMYEFLDLGADKAIEFCAETYSIWCEAAADPDTMKDLLLDMRDQPGGMDRPLKQFVHYIFAREHDLPYLVVQARNAIISTEEMLKDRHHLWFDVDQPEASEIAAKIAEHKGPGKIHMEWIAERATKNRKKKQEDDREARRKEREALEERAMSEGKTLKELQSEIKLDEEVKELRGRLTNVKRLIPKLVTLGLAVPTKSAAPPATADAALFCSYQDTLYEIRLTN